MPPIQHKPAGPPLPPGAVGPHKSGGPSGEQLEQLKDIDEALQKPESGPESGEAPIDTAPDSNADPTVPQNRTRAPDGERARTRDEAGKKSEYRQDLNDTSGSQLPDSLGRRRPDLSPLVRREPGDTARARDLPREGLPTPTERADVPKFVSDRPERPSPERPTSQQYRHVAQDKAFQGPMNGSPLHQKMQARALEQNRQQQAAGEKRASEEVLKRGEVGQLFRMRHKFEKKDDARKVARYEIAKARQEAKEKVRALKYQNEGSQQKEAEADHANRSARSARASRVSQEGDALKDQLSEKLKSTAGESAFEQALQQVLDGGEAVPELPESVRARFTAKTEAEWEEFFKNALSLNSSEIESEGQLDKLVEALFRGLYRRGADGRMVLVSDLSFAAEAGEDPAQYKFSRIALKDGELVSLLERLKPGDVIDKELMRKIGDQFLFTQLLHLVDQLAITDEQKKAILKEFRQQVSANSRDNLEKALRERRERNARNENEAPNPLAAHAGDQFNKKDRHVGPPRFVMYLIYGVIAITVVMILFILFRQAF